MKRGALLVRLAVRNLRRQVRRSVLTATAMTLGLALLVFSRTLADGAHEDWIEAGVRLGSGHLSIQAPGYQANQDIEHRLSAGERRLVRAIVDSLIDAGRITVASERLDVPGLAASPTAALPVLVQAVDPRAEVEVTTLDEKLVSGRYLEPGDRLQAVVGSRLASRLDLRVGSRLVLTAQDVNEEMAGQFVRVEGIFQIGVPEVDEGIIHIPLATAQRWLGVGDDVTRVVAIMPTSRTVGQVAETLSHRLADEGATPAVVPWQRAMPELDAAVRLDDYGDYIFHTILFIIVALAIINTVLMSVLYRVREFGVLRALGLTRHQTGQLVFVEGMILTIVSGVVGLGIGLAVTWLFFREGLDFSFVLDRDMSAAGVIIEPVIVPTFRVAQVVQSLGFILGIGVLASIYPSYRATRIDVAEAMKFEE